MEILQDDDEMMLCPYNSAHRIRKARMGTHLVKCKKSYPNTKLVECDFNCNHKIPEPELKYHHDHCPDKKKIEIACYQEVGQNINKYPVVQLNIETEESWDDINVPTYDPQQYCMNKPILRSLNVASAAERKNFRVAERKRFAELDASASKAAQSQSNKPKPIKPVPRPCETVITEDVPEDINELVKSIKLNANQHFIPKVSPSV